MRNVFTLLLAPVALAALTACSNPAADAPQAEVADAPAEAPAEEPAAEATTWTITDDSEIGFVGSKVTGSHDGGFEAFEGTVSFTGDTPETATVDLTIDMTSTWSDNEKLTGHLKSADFFEVETYPTSTFVSTAIEALPAPAEGEEAEGTHTVTGLLNLHGVEKQISFPATLALTADQMTAQAEFAIQRFDFGIEYPGKADDLIRDDVLIQLDIVAAPAMDAMVEEVQEMAEEMVDEAGEMAEEMAEDVADAADAG